LFTSVLILFAAPVAARQPKDPTPAKTAVVAPKVELTADEKGLVADVEDGEFKTISFAEATLIGSGVTDASKRKGYLATIDLLEAQAKRAVAGSKTDSEKGEKLLAFLHAGPMKKYAKDQTSLSVLLDTGNFNCVSSAVLYNVLARRLGLEVRAVELPRHSHAFSLLRDGERDVDVETTNAKGFDPKRKKTEAAAQAKNRREVKTAGLVAIVAANRCGFLAKEKNYSEAVRAGLCARGLDRELKGVENNFQVALGSWCRDLADDGKIEEALAVLEKNGEPLNAGAKHDEMKGIYAVRLKVFLKQGEYESAARMYMEAARRHKGEKELVKHCRHQAIACFDEWARPHVKKGEWAKVVEIYEKASEILPDDPDIRDRLKVYRKKLDK